MHKYRLCFANLANGYTGRRGFIGVQVHSEDGSYLLVRFCVWNPSTNLTLCMQSTNWLRPSALRLYTTAIRLGGQVQETKTPKTVFGFVNCLNM